MGEYPAARSPPSPAPPSPPAPVKSNPHSSIPDVESRSETSWLHPHPPGVGPGQVLPAEGSDPRAAPPPGDPHLGCVALPSIRGPRGLGCRRQVGSLPTRDGAVGWTVPWLQDSHRLGEQTANPTTETGFFCASRSRLLLEAMHGDKGANVPGWGQHFGPDCQLCKGTSVTIANGTCNHLVQGTAIT